MRSLRLCLLLTALLAWPRAQYLVRTVAGSSFAGDNGPALSALLIQPEGITQDPQGNLYLADAADNRIRKISPIGTITTLAGDGIPGFSGDGGPSTQARLNHPYGIALDPSGHLYIADLGNQRIRVISPSGVISTLAGGGAQPFAPNLPATQAQLNSPRNVTVSIDGTVYFSDFGGQAVYQVKNGILNLYAGNGIAGDTGDGGPAIQAELNFPAGVAIDPSGNLYIADSANNALRKVTQGIISTVASVSTPTGLALDSFGNPYVAANGLLGSPFSPGASTFSANDLAIDPTGAILFTSGHSLQKLAPLGTLTLLAGQASGVFYGDGGPALTARLNQPWSVTLTPTGDLVFADTGNNRIRKVTSSGRILTIAGNGDPSSLNSPAAVASGSQGNLYIADTGNNRVMLLTAIGAYSTLLTQLKSPSALAVDSSGNLYVADRGHSRIVVLSPAGLLAPVASVADPIALALDSHGNLYVSDNSQNALLEIAPGAAPQVIWQGLAAPTGLAVDPSGNVFLSDIASNQIREITAQGVVTAIAGNGTPGFSGDGGPAPQAGFYSPAGLALDPQGNLYVADSTDNRIRELTAAPTAIIPPPGDTAPPFTVANAASNLTGPIAPNEIVSLYGAGFDPATTSVTFNGAPARLFFTGPSQINALVPAAITPGAMIDVAVASASATFGPIQVQAAAAAPGIFTLAGGQGQAAALNQDGSANSTQKPATPSSVVTLFATGQGTGTTVYLTIGGKPAQILYFGPAPGFAGLAQINARIPAGLTPGPAAILLTINGATSQSGTTLAIQ